MLHWWFLWKSGGAPHPAGVSGGRSEPRPNRGPTEARRPQSGLSWFLCPRVRHQHWNDFASLDEDVWMHCSRKNGSGNRPELRKCHLRNLTDRHNLAFSGINPTSETTEKLFWSVIHQNHLDCQFRCCVDDSYENPEWHPLCLWFRWTFWTYGWT